MGEIKQQCPEFPYFGASYPDATCIDGYLWDLDKFEDGHLYGGGEEPCPFCNTETFIEQNLDEENTRESLLTYIDALRKHYSNKLAIEEDEAKSVREAEKEYAEWYSNTNKERTYTRLELKNGMQMASLNGMSNYEIDEYIEKI